MLVFSMLCKEKHGEEWHIGEKNIFNLLNLDMVEGVIMASDMLIQDQLHLELLDRIKKAKPTLPIVSVDIDLPGTAYIGTDDVQSVYSLVSHLIVEHGLTDIAFMTGVEGHPHAKARLEGYYLAMKDHNLPIGENRVFYGDFWYNMGDTVVQKIIDGGNMPQAIACASDTMAVSVCEALKARGIRVPDDVAVTGYDSIIAGLNYVPSITSANRPSDITGMRAVLRLDSMIKGEPFMDFPGRAAVSVAKSCGCRMSAAERMRVEKEAWRDSDHHGDFDSSYNFMMEDLLRENNFENYLWQVGWYGYQIGAIDNSTIVLCEDWNDPEKMGIEKDYITTGYGDRVCAVLTRYDGNSYVQLDNWFDTSLMLPRIYEPRDYATAYIFTPLHFKDRCFGYSVLSYGGVPRSYDTTFRKWIKNVNSSLESLRRQIKLQYMYKRMEQMAVTDMLTGLYNRNGFNLYSAEEFKKAQENGEVFTIVVGDMNNLKPINDTYGHVEGDFAITSMGEAFKAGAHSDVDCFRVGGDVFIAIMKNGNSQRTEEYCRGITEYLDRVNKTAGKEYEISVSLGVYCKVPGKDETLQSAIISADELMFERKQEYKSTYNIKR